MPRSAPLRVLAVFLLFLVLVECVLLAVVCDVDAQSPSDYVQQGGNGAVCSLAKYVSNTIPEPPALWRLARLCFDERTSSLTTPSPCGNLVAAIHRLKADAAPGFIYMSSASKRD